MTRVRIGERSRVMQVKSHAVNRNVMDRHVETLKTARVYRVGPKKLSAMFEM